MSARPPAPHPAPALQATNIVKAFAGRTVLSGVSVGVGRGEVHAVLGPSGAGKTTLLRILNLLDAADGGEVALDGEPVGIARAHAPLNAAQHRARLRMALVPQKPVAFRLTVFENVAFGLRVRGIEGDEVAARVDHRLDEMVHVGRPASRECGDDIEQFFVDDGDVPDRPEDGLRVAEVSLVRPDSRGQHGGRLLHRRRRVWHRADHCGVRQRVLDRGGRAAALGEGEGVGVVVHGRAQVRTRTNKMAPIVPNSIPGSHAASSGSTMPLSPIACVSCTSIRKTMVVARLTPTP